jgi:hypothetical protein
MRPLPVIPLDANCLGMATTAFLSPVRIGRLGGIIPKFGAANCPFQMNLSGFLLGRTRISACSGGGTQDAPNSRADSSPDSPMVRKQ